MQLAMALWLDGWLRRAREPTEAADDDGFQEGFEYTIREIAGHLRQGDFLPTGLFYQEVIRKDKGDSTID